MSHPFFQEYNANPLSRRTGDCVIRAIAAARDVPWEQVFSDLCRLGLKEKRMPNDKLLYPKYLSELGWHKQKQPRKPDGKKLTGREFCFLLSRLGIREPVIAHIGQGHIVCIREGRILDTWDCSQRCIGNFWVQGPLPRETLR